jgi:hypothetical protein
MEKIEGRKNNQESNVFRQYQSDKKKRRKKKCMYSILAALQTALLESWGSAQRWCTSISEC